MVDKLFVATKAFISYEDKVLLVRESGEYDDGANEGLFDVPGGRVEPGQRFNESLRREVGEETGLDIVMGRPFWVDEWRPEVGDEKWQIVGVFFECTAESDDVELGADHDKHVWIVPEDHVDYELIGNLDEAFEVYRE